MRQAGSGHITPQIARTLDGLFRERVRRTPDGIAYIQYDGGEWRTSTWAGMAHEAARWQEALRREGLAEGERVGVLLRNGREWVLFEQAALGLGLVVVPLYVEDRAENGAYVIENAGIRLMLLPDERHVRKLDGALAAPCLKRVVQLHGQVDGADPRIVSAAQWLPDTAPPLAVREGDPAALATVVYTSGTTGRPKGVMLSHRNILEVACAAASVDGGRHFRADDLFLSFLPLSHMFERTAGYYVPMATGATVAYARSVQQLADDLKTLRPTMLVAVPRLFERIYERIQGQLAAKDARARRLLRFVQEVGLRRFEAHQGRKRWSPQLLLWPLLKRLVADRIADGFGGRLRHAITGGAAMQPEVTRFFLGLGISLLQGYGLTEAAPVVSCNLPDSNDPLGVGPALPGVEVRAAGEDQELLVRGPGVMMGYFGDPEATAQVIDAEGWLHTGDQVRIENGHIYITGRLKDILVLSNGEKIPPGDIEAALTLDPLVEQALVLGEGQPCLGALLVLNAEEWRRYALANGVDPELPASLDDHALHRHLIARLAGYMRQFPGYARVRRLALTLEPWTVENGLLTPTLKARRARIAAHYADRLALLFE